MKLFNFFKNTIQEITILEDNNNINPNLEDLICKNFSSKKKLDSGSSIVGCIDCARHCKHCVGYTIRYTNESVEADNNIIQRFVKCKCGHNNIFNVWRRFKYVLSGKRPIIKEINNNGIRRIN